MDTQVRIATNFLVLSMSTRNYPNRFGDGTNVELTSAELAAMAAVLGKLSTPADYMEYAKVLNAMSAGIYRSRNFDQSVELQKKAEDGKRIAGVGSARWREQRARGTSNRFLG
jgi:aconitate hydratase 2/2-methylisocitrate dehydratase